MTATWEIFLPFGFCDFKSPPICNCDLEHLALDRIMEARGGSRCPTFRWAEMGFPPPCSTPCDGEKSCRGEHLSVKFVHKFNHDEDGADVMQFAPENKKT